MAGIVESLLEMNRLFARAASTDPLTALLLLAGTLLIVFSVAVLGYLTLGAVVDLLIPSTSRRANP